MATPLRTKYGSQFAERDWVHIDGDSAIRARVVAVLFRGGRCEVEVAWFHNGTACSGWFPEWRLGLAA